MKKGFKALLILICVSVCAFVALIYFGQNNGEFRYNKTQHVIEYYYFNQVKAPIAKVNQRGKNYSVENGCVTKINSKDKGFITTFDKKKYYIENATVFSGLLGDSLYKEGIFKSDAQGLLEVDGKEYCFKDGKLYSGVYKKSFYKSGILDNSKSGFIEVNGKEYFFLNGVVYNGLYDKVFYTDGLKDVSKNGFFNIEGNKLYLKKGVLFTGLKDKKYYLDGVFDEKTGERVSSMENVEGVYIKLGEQITFKMLKIVYIIFRTINSFFHPVNNAMHSIRISSNRYIIG